MPAVPRLPGCAVRELCVGVSSCFLCDTYDNMSDMRVILCSTQQCRFCRKEHLLDPYTRDHELGKFEEFRFCRLKRNGWNVQGVQGLGLGSDDETVQNLEKCFSIKKLHRVIDERLVPMSPRSAFMADHGVLAPDFCPVGSQREQALVNYFKHYDGRGADTLETKARGFNFDLGDANGDGRIDFAEFCSMNCVQGRSKEELMRLYQILDINRDSKIDKKEFRKFEDQLFASADKNNDLALDFKEFSMLHCNKGRSEQELRQIFSMLDENHDGTIDRDEFRELELCTKEAGAKQVLACPTFFVLLR